jgi:hypothetical protein
MLPDACCQLIVSSQKLRRNFASFIHSSKKVARMFVERQYQFYPLAALMNQLFDSCIHIIPCRNNIPA